MSNAELIALAALLNASVLTAQANNERAKMRQEYPTEEADYKIVDAIEAELKKRNVLKS